MNYTQKEIKELHQRIFTLKEIKNRSKRPEVAEDLIREYKEKIRNLTKKIVKDAAEFESFDRAYYVQEDGFYNVEYRKYETNMSREEMAEWCREYWEDHQVRSMYDCTGQPFVYSIRFAHMRDNIYLVRITWGIDL